MKLKNKHLVGFLAFFTVCFTLYETGLLQLALTIIACMVVGFIAYGLLSGVAIHLYKDVTDQSFRQLQKDKRQTRMHTYKQVAHMAKFGATMPVKVAMMVPAVRMGVRDGQRNVKAIRASQLNPHNRLTVWRPFRSAGRCYADIYKDAKRHPMKYARSLSYGMRITRFRL